MNCEATIDQTPGPFGLVPVACQQTVGVRVWYDDRGDLHAACFRHIAERLHRYPEADPPEPLWYEGMVDHPADARFADMDPMDVARWERERTESWTLA